MEFVLLEEGLPGAVGRLGLDADGLGESCGELLAVGEGLELAHALVLEVEEGVKDESAGGDGDGLGPGVENGLSRCEPGAVFGVVEVTVDGGLEGWEVGVCRLGDVGDGSGESGEEDVVLHEGELEFGEVVSVDVAWGAVVVGGEGGGGADGLSHEGAGGHDAGGAHGDVGAGDVSSGEPEVVDVAGVEGAVGDAKGGGRGVVFAEVSVLHEGVGVVVIDGPAAVADGVVEVSAVHEVVLVEEDVAEEASAFALSWE